MDGTEEEGIFVACVGIEGKVLAYLKRGFPMVCHWEDPNAIRGR